MKNAFGSRSRLFPYTVAAILAAALVAVALTAQSLQFERDIASAREKGRNIYVLQSSSPDRSVAISRNSCEALTDLDTVVRAGFIINQGRQLVQPLGYGIPVLAVSQTLISEVGQGVAVVGAGLRPSEIAGHIVIDEVIAGAVTGKREPAGIEVNSAISILVNPDIKTDSRCYVEMVWAADTADVQVVAARLHVDGGGISAVPTLREPSSATEAFIGRVERWLPILIGTLGGLATAMAIRSRRGELAAYSFGGASQPALGALVTIECAIIGGTAACSGALAALALAPFSLSASSHMFAAIALGSTWSASAITIGVPIVGGSPIELGKRR